MNTTAASLIAPSYRSTSDAIMNDRMYLRKPFPWNTKLRRRRWSRRKHLYAWTTLANVLKDWAFSYRFMRLHTKFVLHQHFFKNSFVSFNLVSAANSLPCLYKKAESIMVSSVTRKVLKYFNVFCNPYLRFLLNIKYVALASASYHETYIDHEVFLSETPISVLAADSITTKLPLDYKDLVTPHTVRGIMASLLQTSAQINLLSVKELYKVLVLLTLFRL